MVPAGAVIVAVLNTIFFAIRSTVTAGPLPADSEGAAASPGEKTGGFTGPVAMVAGLSAFPFITEFVHPAMQVHTTIIITTPRRDRCSADRAQGPSERVPDIKYLHNDRLTLFIILLPSSIS